MSTYSTSAVSSRRLWYGVTAAMAAWIVHGITSFVISDAACAGGRVAKWSSISTRGLQAILIAITAVALAVAISGGLVSWRTWRSLSTNRFQNAQAWGRGEFMALVGVFISAIFTLGIVWAGLAPFLTGLCEATR